MAKKKKPVNQLIPKEPMLNPEMEKVGYNRLTEIMMMETASALTDYSRQYVGTLDNVSTPGSGIFINQDRVLKTQQYLELSWYDLYDELEHDPHVLAVMNTLKMVIASKKWEIVPYKGDKEQEPSARNKEIAKFVENNLRHMDNFTQDLYELNDAIGKGFAASEVIWSVDKDIRIDKLMNRPQRRIQFDAVTREPKIRKVSNPYYGDPVPPCKMVIHRASSKYENPFGDALDQSIYWMWLLKKIVMKFWSIHLETGSSPIPIVQHPQGQNNKYKDEALEVARQIRTASYARIPENMKLIWAEAQQMAAANMSYKDFENFVNSEITKCVLGQILTTEGSSSSGSGSLALGEVHSDVLEARVDFYSTALSCTLNAAPVKWIVDFNYLNVDGYPRFQFITKKPLDRKTEAEIIQILKNAGYKVKREYIENTLEMPLEEEEVEPVVDPNNLIVANKLKQKQEPAMEEK
jgi:phage gp29-like protein